jgi:hypothetical protein
MISSDVLRRHEKGHQNDTIQSQNEYVHKMACPTPSSLPAFAPSIDGCSPKISTVPPSNLELSTAGEGIVSPTLGVVLNNPTNAGSDPWLLGTPIDLDALDFTLTSAISEWAELPLVSPTSNFSYMDMLSLPVSACPQGNPIAHQPLPIDIVQQKWFTRLSVVEDGNPAPQSALNGRLGCLSQGNVIADEHYRAGLSQRLQPRMHDEPLPSLQQLHLFMKLFFSRFHPLLPVVHAPSFKPSTENSLLFVSICSVGSLFVGSPYAVAQGTRLFERLNKAILASWESILSRSCSDALSMVQAAIIGQTFAILSGRPRDLVMADVLHGTVMAWARQCNKGPLGSPYGFDPNGDDLEEQWSRWIDREQRRRVEIALNIHDAELSSLLRHEPIRKHQLSQYPRVGSDALFAAPSALQWAELYRKSSSCPSSPLPVADTLHAAEGESRFAAYGVLESIHAHVIEVRQSDSFDKHESARLMNMLMRWWRRYKIHMIGHEDDPYGLRILWHSVFMAIYANIDMLEQAIGRDGTNASTASRSKVRSWSQSLAANRCLVHGLLIQWHLEQMRISSEPAIHVPRALFYTSLCSFSFTRVGGHDKICFDTFDAPEIQLLAGESTGLDEVKAQAIGDSAFLGVSHLHRLIDLHNRVGRWGISKSFASILCTALENDRCT